MPLADVVAEAERIYGEAEARGVTIRFLGGIGLYYSCPSATTPPFKRSYRDIDVIGHKRQSREILDLFKSLGYAPRARFNALHGYRRLIFNDLENMRRVDVFLDVFDMALRFDFRERLELCRPALPVSDLLLTKAQVIKANEKDLLDILLLFHDHGLGNDPCNNIERGYLVSLASRGWPVYMALKMNLQKALSYLPALSLDPDKREVIEERIQTLLSDLESFSKPLSWRIRASLGERIKWYREVEEDQEVVTE